MNVWDLNKENKNPPEIQAVLSIASTREECEQDTINYLLEKGWIVKGALWTYPKGFDVKNVNLQEACQIQEFIEELEK